MHSHWLSFWHFYANLTARFVTQTFRLSPYINLVGNGNAIGMFHSWNLPSMNWTRHTNSCISHVSFPVSTIEHCYVTCMEFDTSDIAMYHLSNYMQVLTTYVSIMLNFETVCRQSLTIKLVQSNYKVCDNKTLLSMQGLSFV